MTLTTVIKYITYIIFFSISSACFSQVTVNGTVSNSTGIPLPGVNIVETETSNGVLTDFDGNFSITVTQIGATIEVSYVGFKTQRIAISSETNLNINLEEDQAVLDEVVVIGYQTVKKSDVTGAVSKIKTEQLAEIPSNSIEETLVGRVPGLVVNNTSDDPGAGVNVRIRGASSFTATTPLIVVDGFPLGDAGNLKQINPADIVSVEVLKDASSASIYGSRGANGVILVTTKRGQEGTMEVTFSHIASTSSFSREFDIFRNPVNLAVLTDESRANSGFTPLYIGAEDVNGTFFPSIEQIRNDYPITNYIDYVFNNPINTNSNISIIGGNEQTKYNFGLNYNTQNGIYREDELSKVTVSIGIDQKLSGKINLSTNLNFSRGSRNENLGLQFDRNITFPLLNEDGSFFQANENDFGNPAALTELRSNESTTIDLISSSIFRWELTDALQFKSQFNYSLGSSYQERFFPTQFTQLGFEGNGVAFQDNFQNQRVVVDAYLNYDKFLREDHKITLLGGYSSEYFEVRTSQLRSQDFPNQSLGAGNLSLGNEQRTSNNFIESALSSVISRINYAYKDKYLFTYTGRLDGSSNFGANNRFAFFPSGAVSWKMQNENFIQESLTFVNELKPRISWGVVGNQAISPFETLNRLGQGNFFVNGDFVTTVGPGIGSNNGIFSEFRGLGNPDLKWETTTIFDVGLDFSAFDRRLDFVVDYYNKTTDDLLVDSSLPPTSGFDFIRINAGKIENEGIEVAVNYDFIRNDNFTLSAGVIFNKNKNKVLSLGPVALNSVQTDEFGNNFRFTGFNFRDQFRSRINILAIDQPINAFYGARVTGIVQSEEEGLFNGLSGAGAFPGEFLYDDLNGDGVIDPFGKDRTIIGDPNPDFTASFTFDASYKNWELTVLFNGSFGGDVANINRFSTQAGGGQVSNLLQRYTPDNRSNEFPSLRETRNVAFSDFWLEDGTFVRLQNLRVGYNIDVSRINYVNRLKIYFSGDNLHTFTGYEGTDPEVGPTGIGGTRVPRLRRYALGINVSI
ncbi:TonB-dependent receptor [Aquimarina sp. ERC-38]|uniref:SusC/RagA family TonB-linked outer membrane protein n=1 Tax=Aquimarina sp. ERC-38 TaxID=2949996 RepID=UPI0022453A82|nr:TonB-dependent receptor [Aquimarina sp. ERC-38]UZO80942.1 TonB-dependent receptor [Aquimarina sp. ERC-38]